jgi:phosphohistidine phosphatase SixA
MHSFRIAALVCFFLYAVSAHADEAALNALKAGGHIVMIRHSLTTPGSGDPPGFDISDCKTQRNLVDAGRDEAKKFAALLRANGVKIERVSSSQWCRCVETARLMEFGEPEIATALNNLFGRPEPRAAQVAGMREIVSGWKGTGNLLLVTHGITMAALVGIDPATTTGVVLAPAPRTKEGYRLVGRITPDG